MKRSRTASKDVTTVKRLKQAPEIRPPPPSAAVSNERPGKISFVKDLPMMMYGFGDIQHPQLETVECLEDIVLEFMSDLCKNAIKNCMSRTKLKADDFVFAVRRDRRMHDRAQDLLMVTEVVKNAKKTLDAKQYEE